MSQKTTSTLERIERLERDLQQMKQFIVTQNETTQYVMQKSLAIEQSFASLAKTLTALIAEMVETKVVDDQSVMKRIREMDEQGERDRVRQLLEQHVIESTDEAITPSLVAIKQTAMEVHPEKGTRETLISGYRLIELPPSLDSVAEDDTIRKMVGLKVGNSIELQREERDGTVVVLTATVLEIYRAAQQGEGSSEEGKEAP